MHGLYALGFIAPQDQTQLIGSLDGQRTTWPGNFLACVACQNQAVAVQQPRPHDSWWQQQPTDARLDADYRLARDSPLDGVGRSARATDSPVIAAPLPGGADQGQSVGLDSHLHRWCNHTSLHAGCCHSAFGPPTVLVLDDVLDFVPGRR